MKGSAIFALGVLLSASNATSNGRVDSDELAENFGYPNEYHIVHEFGKLDSAIRAKVHSTIRRILGVDESLEITDFGLPYFHSMLVDDPPDAQHQFSAVFDTGAVLVLVKFPAEISGKFNYLLALFLSDIESHCAFVTPAYPSIDSVDYIQSQIFMANEVFLERIECVPLDEVDGSVEIRPRP